MFCSSTLASLLRYQTDNPVRIINPIWGQDYYSRPSRRLVSDTLTYDGGLVVHGEPHSGSGHHLWRYLELCGEQSSTIIIISAPDANNFCSKRTDYSLSNSINPHIMYSVSVLQKKIRQAPSTRDMSLFSSYGVLCSEGSVYIHSHRQTLTVSLKTGLAQWYWTREWYTLTHGSPMPAAIQF